MTIQEMRDRKQELGYSYAMLAERAGLPVGTVQKILGGYTKAPRYETLRKLEQALLKKTPDGDGSVEGAGETELPRSLSAPEGSEVRYTREEEDPDPYSVREAAEAYDLDLPLKKKQGEYTVEDYLALPNEPRMELIDGCLLVMEAPSTYHQIVAGAIYSRLTQYKTEKKLPCLPLISPTDVQLDCDDRTMVQPDVLVLCDLKKLTPKRIFGAPDLVIEVLSPGTRKKDMFIKAGKYHDAGVREYWMVNLRKRRVVVYDFMEEDLISLYTFRDRIPVAISGGDCEIDFSEIDDFLQSLPGED